MDATSGIIFVDGRLLIRHRDINMVKDMDIKKEYENLREAVLANLPDTFTINNNLIEECPYDASYMPINFNPYKQNGCYYPTFCEYMPRVYTGKAPIYKMTKGEETTICMWNGMLKYEEYDLLADLLILGFLHDCHDSIAGIFYTLDEMDELMEISRAVLEENRYGKHNPRCKKYLSLYNGKTFFRYRKDARNDVLEIKDTAEFARIMMEIIVDEYGSKYFIIRCPSDLSIERAKEIQSEATKRFFEKVFN